jgi:hypothetical protein
MLLAGASVVFEAAAFRKREVPARKRAGTTTL